MTRYQVDSAAVAAASAAIGKSSGQINAEVATMLGHLLELQHSWQGQAANSFQEVVTQWRGTQERVRANLEQIQVALANAGQNYSGAEGAAVRMFS